MPTSNTATIAPTSTIRIVSTSLPPPRFATPLVSLRIIGQSLQDRNSAQGGHFRMLAGWPSFRQVRKVRRRPHGGEGLREEARFPPNQGPAGAPKKPPSSSPRSAARRVSQTTT